MAVKTYAFDINGNFGEDTDGDYVDRADYTKAETQLAAALALLREVGYDGIGMALGRDWNERREALMKEAGQC